MNTITGYINAISGRRFDRQIPQTPRGRALYTVDYFINGKPALLNHDNPQVQLRSGFKC